MFLKRLTSSRILLRQLLLVFFLILKYIIDLKAFRSYYISDLVLIILRWILNNLIISY